MGLRWYDLKKIPKINNFNRQFTEIIQIVDKYEIVNLNACNLYRKNGLLVGFVLECIDGYCFTNDFVNISCFRISISFFVHLLQICKEAF